MNTHRLVRHIVRTVLDTLFPPSENTLVVRSVTTPHLTSLLHIQRTSHVTALLSFRNPVVRSCIHEAKFSGNKRAQRLLASVLQKYLSAHIYEPFCIIPIPLSSKRKRERGYNQVTEIAKHIPECIIEDRALVRKRHTTPQTELSKEERTKNIREAFAVQKRYAERIYRKHIILLDDVVTTGATLREAEKALLRAKPASITCIALAH